MMIKILLLLVVAAVKGNKLDNTKSTISLEHDSIRLHCAKNVTLENFNEIEAFKETVFAKTVIIDSCIPSIDKSYADLLKTLNVDVSKIKKMHIENSPYTEYHLDARGEEISGPRRPNKNHFTGLDLEELHFRNGATVIDFRIELSFLKDLKKLKKLVIQNIIIEGPFPSTSMLETVELSGGRFEGEIGEHCSRIKVFHLSEIYFTNNVDCRLGLMKDCKQLAELNLEYLDKNSYECSFLQSLPRTLRNITIRHCDLDRFPTSSELFSQPFRSNDIYLLSHIDLSFNSLDSSSTLETYEALKTIDLSNNNMGWEQDEQFFYPNATDLNLDHNNLENFCHNRIIHKAEYSSKFLKWLSLANSGLQELCFDSIWLPALELVNLTNNNITVLDYRQLFNVSGHQVEVDLRNNPLNRVNFTREDYEALKRNDTSVANWRNLNILTQARLTCNCTHAWLGRALRENLLRIEGATCIDGLSLELPRLSYALDGCGAACEGADGCSAANAFRNIRINKDNFISVFTEHNSILWISNKIYDLIVGN